MKAIILAGGKGIRLQPYTRVLPKALCPLDDMPILQIILQQLRDTGFSACTLAVSHKAQQIASYFGDGHWLGIDIDYSYSPVPLGTAGPLSLMKQFDEPCLVINGDVLTSIDFAGVYQKHLASEAMATLVLCPHTVNIQFGLVEVDPRQTVTSYVEKPSFSYFISAGIYAFNPSVLDFIERGKYVEVPELIQKLLKAKHTVHSYIFEKEWFDIGTTEQYMQAEEAFCRHRERFLRSSKCMPVSELVGHDGHASQEGEVTPRR